MSNAEAFINQVSDDNFSGAESTFNDLVKEKMMAALDQKRIELASTIFKSNDRSEETE